jgi:hypothetical protein
MADEIGRPVIGETEAEVLVPGVVAFVVPAALVDGPLLQARAVKEEELIGGGRRNRLTTECHYTNMKQPVDVPSFPGSMPGRPLSGQ